MILYVKGCVGIHRRRNRGKVFQTEGTASAEPGSKGMAWREHGAVLTREEKLHGGQKPDVPDFRFRRLAHRFGFCLVGRKDSWEVFRNKTRWGETGGREASWGT